MRSDHLGPPIAHPQGLWLPRKTRGYSAPAKAAAFPTDARTALKKGGQSINISPVNKTQTLVAHPPPPPEKWAKPTFFTCGVTIDKSVSQVRTFHSMLWCNALCLPYKWSPG